MADIEIYKKLREAYFGDGFCGQCKYVQRLILEARIETLMLIPPNRARNSMVDKYKSQLKKLKGE